MTASVAPPRWLATLLRRRILFLLMVAGLLAGWAAAVGGVLWQARIRQEVRVFARVTACEAAVAGCRRLHLAPGIRLPEMAAGDAFTLAPDAAVGAPLMTGRIGAVARGPGGIVLELDTNDPRPAPGDAASRWLRLAVRHHRLLQAAWKRIPFTATY